MQDTTVLLSSFSPLIQLLAGICLLFFYCELLKYSPFAPAQDRLCTLYKEIYDELTTKYQVFLPEDTDSLKSNISFDSDNHWNRFRSSIYCLAIFCFFYCLLILLIAGIENHVKYGLCFSGLLVTNTIAFVFYIVIFYSRYRSRLFAIIIALLLGFYIIIHYHLFKNATCFNTFSHTFISVYTLITCVLGLILIGFSLCYDLYVIFRCELSIQRIKKVFNEWTGLPFNKSKRKIIKYTCIMIVDLVKALLKVFSNQNLNFDKSLKKSLENYLKRKVQKELSYIYKKSEQWEKSK